MSKEMFNGFPLRILQNSYKNNLPVLTNFPSKTNIVCSKKLHVHLKGSDYNKFI